MTVSLRPLTALVTGASRGIGRAIAAALAARGARIAVHFHRHEAAATALCRELPGEGHQAFGADLADADAAARLWKAASAAFDGIDVLVNNAGLYASHPPLTTDYDAWTAVWRHTLATNLVAPAHLSVLASQDMAARPPRAGDWGRGRIVNVSSRGAFRGEPDAPAYGASKAGLNALSQSLAQGLAPHGIYVFCLAPGWVGTDMAAGHVAGPDGAAILAQHPLGRIATPEEVAASAVFCALDAPAAMTGCVIDINGASYLRT